MQRNPVAVRRCRRRLKRYTTLDVCSWSRGKRLVKSRPRPRVRHFEVRESHTHSEVRVCCGLTAAGELTGTGFEHKTDFGFKMSLKFRVTTVFGIFTVGTPAGWAVHILTHTHTLA